MFAPGQSLNGLPTIPGRYLGFTRQAIEEPLLFANREAWGIFFMKRTARRPVLSGFFDRQMTADYLDYV